MFKDDQIRARQGVSGPDAARLFRLAPPHRPASVNHAAGERHVGEMIAADEWNEVAVPSGLQPVARPFHEIALVGARLQLRASVQFQRRLRMKRERLAQINSRRKFNRPTGFGAGIKRALDCGRFETDPIPLRAERAHIEDLRGCAHNRAGVSHATGDAGHQDARP